VHQVVCKRIALVVAALSIAFVAPVTAAGVTATCANAADGETVAIVVDFGDVTDEGTRPGGVETFCVPWNSDLSGAQAMKDAGLTLRFGSSGLLCAINGYPAEGCGEKTGDRAYNYWSYWKTKAGETAWSYSTTGAATKVRAGATEGWRFVKGAGSPNDPQPRHAPDHGAICPVVPDPPAANPGFAAPDDGGGTAQPARPSTGAVDVPARDLPAAAAADTSSTTTVAPDGTLTLNASSDEVALSDATPASSSSNAGAVAGAVAVAALIVALAGAALWRARRPADG
jgi:hypothetical protein